MNLNIIETIGIILVVLARPGIDAYINFCKAREFWTKNSIFYKFHVKENEDAIADGDKILGYVIWPTFTITNLSNYEWRIKKICIAQLSWIKSMMIFVRGRKGYKTHINKLDILREFPLDNEAVFAQDENLHLPIQPQSERTVQMTYCQGSRSMCLNRFIFKNGRIYLGAKEIKSKRHYWIAVINERECLVGSMTEYITKNMKAAPGFDSD